MNGPTEPFERAIPDGAAFRLLIVEDDEGHAEAIRRAFEGCGSGASLSMGRTLADFRRAREAGSTDLALVDLNLPDGRAIEILSSPLEEGPFPVLVMTSFGNEQVAVEAMKAGAIDYVVKSPEAFAGMPRTVERARRQWRVLQEKRQVERRNRQLTRVYRLLSDINQAIVRVRDLEALFAEACRVAVETGGVQGAWIGLLDEGSTGLAFSRQSGNAAVDAMDPGPVWAAIAAGARSICNDVRVEGAAAPWREPALRCGVLSWAALPLVVEGAVVGAFCLYSAEAGTF
ncbi:MAG: GAF domain-containing protein, partial [Deltaproteobacteria bacterium]|nr:GAF domain-containing protein [Deltaproteobacteria bacterium]